MDENTQGCRLTHCVLEERGAFSVPVKQLVESPFLYTVSGAGAYVSHGCSVWFSRLTPVKQALASC